MGKTGWRVSEIGLGASQLGRPTVSDQQAETILNTALDLGINFIDSAAMYKLSEERIGKFIGHRKDEFFIATKCGDYNVVRDGQFTTVKDYTPAGILRTIDQSRQKLKLDVIDMLLFHGLPAEAEELPPAMDTLLKAKADGLARYIGVSADKAFTDAEAARWPIDVQEFTYNIVKPESAESIMPALASRDMGTIIKQPIANAVFLQETRPEGTYFVSTWDRAKELPLKELAGDMPLVDFALRFTLSHPGVHTAIVGTTNPGHLAANARVSDGVALPEEVMRRLQASGTGL
jgi:aryl-alcohol dehydrogenase-like predicted oxidoreductase